MNHPSIRPRVLVSTDIGGTDFDDFQSLVHYLVYADRFDTEGIISSPMGATGRKEHILSVIDVYEKDYPTLRTWSDHYPTPDALRSMSKQGATAHGPLAGFSTPTDASKWIIHCAHKDDSRPLWLLMWGGLEDLAQALHDDPSIKPKLRVYFIGGPNKKWSTTAYDYIARNHPDLWMIENNSTYYGWFLGGNQAGDLGNSRFTREHVANHGALGEFFATGISFNYQKKTNVKMGDTPTVAYLLSNPTPEDPTQPSWGGHFVRAWDRPRVTFTQVPSLTDVVQTYAIVEIIHRPPQPSPPNTKTVLQMDDQEFPAFVDDTGAWHFIYSPKSPRQWNYRIKSTDTNLNGLKGSFTSVLPAANLPPSSKYPNWWTDDCTPEAAEGDYQGAKHINSHREQYLRDFARQMDRCQTPRRP